MKIWFSFFFITFCFLGGLHAQRLEKFSEENNAFIKELQDYMTAGKSAQMEGVFKDFEKIYKSGVFSPEEMVRIRTTGDKMLEQRMTANPYFSGYLKALSVVKNDELGESRFKTWHSVLDSLLANIENRRLKPFQDFVEFSSDFFSRNALRSSDLGTSWLFSASRYDMVYEEKKPLIKFDKLDLIATRGKDSIMIKATAGVFSPVEEIWRGNGGVVSWERLGLGNDVYAELAAYDFEAKNSLYEVKSAKMHYPLSNLDEASLDQAILGNCIH